MSGEALIDFASRWKLNGDWIECRVCKRPQQVSWCLHPFPHRDGCKHTAAEGQPWLTLRGLIGAQVSHAKPPGESDK